MIHSSPHDSTTSISISLQPLHNLSLSVCGKLSKLNFEQLSTFMYYFKLFPKLSYFPPPFSSTYNFCSPLFQVRGWLDVKPLRWPTGYPTAFSRHATSQERTDKRYQAESCQLTYPREQSPQSKAEVLSLQHPQQLYCIPSWQRC